jgi:predicted dehydrogenase
MTLRVAVLGTGWVVDHHLKALASLPTAHVAAIAGRNGARTRELASKTGARPYELENLGEMLRSESLDGVFICLPPHLHGEIEARCSEHVPAVFIEKPVSCDLDSARRASEAFVRADTLVSVGYMSRYRASVGRAKAILGRDDDPPVLVNGFWVGEMPPPRWWRTMSQSGGQFVEQCTHMVDLSRHLVGEITEVSAYATKGFVDDVADYSVDDAAVVNARFAKGAIGTFATGCFTKAGHASGLGIGLTVATRTTKCALAGWDVDLEVVRRDGHIEKLRSTEPDIFAIEDAAFLQAIQTKNRALVRSSYADAVETLKVGLAANRSMREGKPIALADL